MLETWKRSTGKSKTGQCVRRSGYLSRTADRPRFPLHWELQGRTRVQPVAFREWLLSEVMLRTPAFLLRRKGKRIRGQISSSPVPSFFIFPGPELRPWLCGDRRHEQGLGRSAGTGETECQRTRRVQEQLALQRTRKGGEEEEGGRRGCIRAPGASFRPSALSHNHQNTALVPRVAGLFICSLASHGGPHPPIICCRFMSGVL